MAWDKKKNINFFSENDESSDLRCFNKSIYLKFDWKYQVESEKKEDKCLELAADEGPNMNVPGSLEGG